MSEKDESTDDLHTALHFLSNIPFGEAGVDDDRERGEGSSSDTDSSSEEEDNKATKRILLVPGDKNFEPVVIRPGNRQKWERTLVRRGVLNGRIFFSPSTIRGAAVSSRGYPTAVFSLVPYRRRKKQSQSQVRSELETFGESKRGGFSTRHLLHATWGQCSWIRDQRDEHPIDEMNYHPDFLDDPEIRQSKQRTVMHLPGYMQTMIPYVRRWELEEQLNSQFRQKHPWLSTDLTLSKIRRLKRLTVHIALKTSNHVAIGGIGVGGVGGGGGGSIGSSVGSGEGEGTSSSQQGLELGTVALAHVFFEKLVLRQCVKKHNYKSVMATCLLLAFKFNEPSSCAVPGDHLATPPKNHGREKLMQRIEHYFSISAKEVVRMEYRVFMWLRFELHVRASEVDSHFRRILKGLKPPVTAKEYLGSEMYERLIRNSSS